MKFVDYEKAFDVVSTKGIMKARRTRNRKGVYADNVRNIPHLTC